MPHYDKFLNILTYKEASDLLEKYDVIHTKKRNYIIETKRKEISFGINGEKSADEYIIAQNKSFA